MTKRRIETKRAQALRSKRQHAAAPGGFHDGLVKFLAQVLPIGVGIMAALMIITPLSPRGEVSFLLDRNKVAMIDERLSVDDAMYRGKDNKGRPFSLTAGDAVQRSGAEGIVRMNDLVARIALRDGPATLTADAGAYTIEEEKVAVVGPLMMKAADGYAITANGVTFDLEGRRMTGTGTANGSAPEGTFNTGAITVDMRTRSMRGTGGISGTVPAGRFSGDTIAVDMDARTIILDGNARLNMVPGKLRIP